MTVETCQKMLENCRKHGDEAGVKYYEERISKKLAKPQYKDHPLNNPKKEKPESKPKEKK